MATLTANLSSTALDVTVTGSTVDAVAGTQYRIDDEVITLRAFVRQPLPWSPRNRNRWNVSRGQAGTTASTHLAGAAIVGTEEAVTTGTTLTPPTPFAGEGGSDIELVASETDPGAVGAGWIWMQSQPGGAQYISLYRRNVANDAWTPAGIAAGFTEDEWFRALVEAQDSGRVFVQAYDLNQNITAEVRVTQTSLEMGTKNNGSDLVRIEMTNQVVLIGLPTVDPAVAGALWNDTGTVKISDG